MNEFRPGRTVWVDVSRRSFEGGRRRPLVVSHPFPLQSLEVRGTVETLRGPQTTRSPQPPYLPTTGSGSYGIIGVSFLRLPCRSVDSSGCKPKSSETGLGTRRPWTVCRGSPHDKLGTQKPTTSVDEQPFKGLRGRVWTRGTDGRFQTNVKPETVRLQTLDSPLSLDPPAPGRRPNRKTRSRDVGSNRSLSTQVTPLLKSGRLEKGRLR